jgi:hypothetical protein
VEGRGGGVGRGDGTKIKMKIKRAEKANPLPCEKTLFLIMF